MANQFETYVRNNPDLLAAYDRYKAGQNPNAVDSWEVEGISQGVGGMTADHPGTQMSMAQFGHTHYAQYGQGEGRPLEAASTTATSTASTSNTYTDTGHTDTPIADSTWVDNTPTADDFNQTTQNGAEQVAGWDRAGGDYLNYVLSNPDLRENAEALGLTQSEMAAWGQEHWNTWGSRTIEQVPGHGRANTPFEIRWEAGYQSPWDVGENPPVVYEGMDIEDVLEQSIQAQYDVGLSGQGPQVHEMWQAREDISPDWNQGQFTGQGWNFAADQPYATGILADQIEVNRDIGQLVPTTAAGNVGDLRFLQDRYIDEAIANDFPVGWTTPENTWAGAAPQQLGNYWDVLTNAYRTPEGILRRAADYDPLTAVGPSVSPGTRGGGNVRGGYGTTGVGTGVGPGVGGLISNQAYTQPSPLDWSAIKPEVSYTPQFEALTGNLMSNWQPWATGQATPGGLVDYQIPGGATPSVTYSGGNPSLFNTGGSGFSGNTTTDTSGTKWVMTPQGNWVKASSDYGQGLTGQGRLFYDQHYDSSGNYVGAEGLSPEEQGLNWAADAHEAMYPGSQAAANLAGYSLLGATSLNPAYTDYKDYQREIMGLSPGQKFDSEDWIDAFDDMTPENINVYTEMAGWTPAS